jgi:hypothetical protein
MHNENIVYELRPTNSEHHGANEETNGKVTVCGLTKTNQCRNPEPIGVARSRHQLDQEADSPWPQAFHVAVSSDD